MDQLTGLLGSEVRAKLVVHFVVHPESRLGTRSLARHIGVPGKRSLQIELDRLVELGLLERRREGREVLVSRNWDHPQWKALTSLVQEYAPTLVLQDALADVPGLKAAFIFGSFARGDARPDSDIDLFLYGDDIPDRELGKAILEAAVVLDRPLDAKWYDSQKFRRDAQPGASFLPRALQGPKLWLAGSPADLPDTAAAA
ncbi:MAG TPA: nucleotidyltransferase domain-containing protein [Longimicrobium sp.]|jgi:DNA-binding transcriptional ArsR family regulator